MTTAPVVELGFNPTDLRPRDLPRAGAFLGSPADALEAALAVTRAAMVDEMKSQVRGLAEPTHAQLLRIADLAWQGLFWKYRKISAPVMADAYVRAYAKANAGDVPISVIYDLADKHAEKIGDYFQATSRDALADGFNTLVNRRLPAKAAADRVLDAYGLAPRQMRGYLRQDFNTPVSDVLPRSLKARARTYIDKAFTTRTRKLSRQEEHNIDEQAKQFAWMWLQDKGRLTKNAQKMWITAHDERVCPQCGPLHGQKVAVNEQFVTNVGQFWTPGLHPNCRCVVRLIENTFSKSDWDPREHPRGGDIHNMGRFTRKAQLRPVLVKEREVETKTDVEPESEPVTAPTEAPVQLPLGAGKQAVLGTRSQTQSALGTGVPAAVQTPLGTPVQTPLGTQVQTPLGTQVQAVLGLKLPTKAPVKPPLPKLDGPHYAVVDPDQDFQLAGDRFYAKKEDALREAARQRQELVDREWRLRCGPNGDNSVEFPLWDEDSSQVLTAQVSSHDFLAALQSFAHEAQDGQNWMEMSANYDKIPVVYRGKLGVERHSVMSSAEMVHKQGIEVSDFVQQILVVENIHADQSLIRRIGPGVIEVSGDYIASGGWVGSTLVDAGGKPIVTFGIEPRE